MVGRMEGGNMPAKGEYTYFEQIGEEGRVHSINKPFSDSETPRLFMDMGAIFSLLPRAPARVLECGCGTGWLSYFLARKGYTVVGQDCNTEAIDLARSNPVFRRDSTPEFVCSDFEALGYKDEFDAILFYASLHHSQEEQKTIRGAYCALRENGVFIAIEPGLGHHAKSRGTIDKYDVGDRDMPPNLVVRLGKRAGFRETHIYQHPGQLTSMLYREEPHSTLIKKVCRVPGGRYLLLFLNLLVFRRYNGLVWMRK